MSLGKIATQWTSEQAAAQAQTTYQDYKKIKGFKDVGYLLQSYVVSGGEVTKDVQRNDTIDVTDIAASLNNNIMARDGVSFSTTTPNTVYYLDFHKDGDWRWGTIHPTGTVGVDYLTVASVTTDSNGMVNVITDTRGPVGGFRLDSEYGLEGYATTEQLAETTKTAPNRSARLLHGVIRNSSGTWEYITDATHRSMNFSSISVVGNALRLSFDFTAAKIGALLITTDEFMASQNMQVGASVGVGYADVYFYAPMACVLRGDGVITLNNPILDGVLSTTVLANGSGWVINHPEVTLGSDDIPVVSLMQESGTTRTSNIRASWTTFGVTISNYSGFTGYIYYDGTNWIVTTDNINKPTMSFNNATGELTVTHNADTAQSNNLGAFAQSRGTYVTNVSSAATNTFIVQFLDFAGTVVTAPNTNMRFFYWRNMDVVTTMPTSVRVCVRRGNIQVPAASMNTGATGNFWVQGTMEINSM